MLSLSLAISALNCKLWAALAGQVCGTVSAVNTAF